MFEVETVFAQEPMPTMGAGGAEIDIGGWLDEVGNPFVWKGLGDISVLISRGVELVILVAGLLFLAWFVWGAFEWLTSGGDKEAVKRARDRLTSAGIGLGLVLASWAIFMIVVHLFGLPIFEEGEGYTSTPPGQPPGTIDCCVVNHKDCCETGRVKHRYVEEEEMCWRPGHYECL